MGTAIDRSWSTGPLRTAELPDAEDFAHTPARDIP